VSSWPKAIGSRQGDPAPQRKLLPSQRSGSFMEVLRLPGTEWF